MMPALFTKISSRPKSVTISATICCKSATDACLRSLIDLLKAPAQRGDRLTGLIALAAIERHNVRFGFGQRDRHRLPQPRLALVTRATRPSSRN